MEFRTLQIIAMALGCPPELDDKTQNHRTWGDHGSNLETSSSLASCHSTKSQPGMILGEKSHQHFHPDVNADTVVALMLWEQPNHFLIGFN